MPSRWWSYLRSIPVIVRGFDRPLEVLWRLAVARRRPGVARLRGGVRLAHRDALELWVIKEVCLDREYERGLSPLPAAATVVDVGAGIGELAVPLAVRLPAARVIAVEPAPDSRALLERNLACNGATNVEVVAAAVAPDDGGRFLDLSRPPALRPAIREAREGAVAVASVTLASLLERHHVARCDLLKVDCEGGEEELLAAAPDELLARVDRIVVETHRIGAPERLAARLEGAGFAVRVVPSRAHRHLALVSGERPGQARAAEQELRVINQK